MPSRDAVRLRHMQDAIALALKMAKERNRQDLTSDGGRIEAVRRVRLRFPGIPCAKMISMRNRLIHAYFDVDLDIVWTTVSEDLPPLLPLLEAALAQIDS